MCNCDECPYNPNKHEYGFVIRVIYDYTRSYWEVRPYRKYAMKKVLVKEEKTANHLVNGWDELKDKGHVKFLIEKRFWKPTYAMRYGNTVFSCDEDAMEKIHSEMKKIKKRDYEVKLSDATY